MKRALCFAILTVLLGSLISACKEGEGEGVSFGEGAILLLGEEGEPGRLAMDEVRSGLIEYLPKDGAPYIKSCVLSREEPSFLAIQRSMTKETRLVIGLGHANEEAMFQAQSRYPEVMFLFLNGEPCGETGVYETKANSFCIRYKEEQAGFLAGYGAVKEGYRKLGFCGGSEEADVSRYGHGFIQGADFAAGQLKLGPGSVDIRCWYAGEEGKAEVEGKMSGWYEDGVELVFSCDSASEEVTPRVISAAEKQKKR